MLSGKGNRLLVRKSDQMTAKDGKLVIKNAFAALYCCQDVMMYRKYFA